MRKQILSVGCLVGIVVGVLAFASGADQSATPPSETIGRYQVLVVGEIPRYAMPGVMKLDTATGDTWILGWDSNEKGERGPMLFFPIGLWEEKTPHDPSHDKP